MPSGASRSGRRSSAAVDAAGLSATVTARRRRLRAEAEAAAAPGPIAAGNTRARGYAIATVVLYGSTRNLRCVQYMRAGVAVARHSLYQTP